MHLPEEVQPLFHGFGLECFEGIPQNPGQFEGKGYFVLAHLLQSLRTDHLHGTCEPSDEVISASENINHSIDEPGAILMEEIWRQEEDLPRHLRSETYRLVLLVMEMAEGPPEIRFDAITRSGGFEIIEDERMAKKKAPDHS